MNAAIAVLGVDVVPQSVGVVLLAALVVALVIAGHRHRRPVERPEVRRDLTCVFCGGVICEITTNAPDDADIPDLLSEFLAKAIHSHQATCERPTGAQAAGGGQ